mgnify:CR=1 FL=1
MNLFVLSLVAIEFPFGDVDVIIYIFFRCICMDTYIKFIWKAIKAVFLTLVLLWLLVGVYALFTF